MYTVTVTAEFSVTGNFFLFYSYVSLRDPVWEALLLRLNCLCRRTLTSLILPSPSSNFAALTLLGTKGCEVQKWVYITERRKTVFFAWMLTERWHWPLLSLFSWKLCCKNSSKTLINRRSACLWYKVFKRKDTSRFKAFPTCAFEWNNKM